MSINGKNISQLLKTERSLLGLNGKSAVITGAARGIGKSTSFLLSSLGVNIGIIDITEHGTAVVNEIKNSGGNAIYVQGDVTDAEKIQKCMDRIAEEFNGIDFLVNNAGISSKIPFEELQMKDWQKIIDVNLTGAYVCTKSALKHLKKKTSSSIVMFSSGSTITGTGGCAAYAAAKGGINSFTRALARQLAKYNVRVNAVSPRTVRTEMLETVFNEADIAEMEKHIPLKRLGEEKEIASVVMFLLSDLASFITGENILIDGGRTFCG
jgi:NAD(P)-dependent dehydrogenase (short-subunit alcohol dehydrogenase family)